MMKKTYSPEQLSPTQMTVKLEAHVVESLKTMEKHTKIPLDKLVGTALKMFIATHNDYLGIRR